jgi:hypothetical protein
MHPEPVETGLMDDRNSNRPSGSRFRLRSQAVKQFNQRIAAASLGRELRYLLGAGGEHGQQPGLVAQFQ